MQQEPFSQIPEWVAVSELSDQAVRLYLVLANYADRDGRSYPSRKTLAADMGKKSISSISAALDELRRYGAIQVTPRYFENSNGRRSSYYTLVTGNPQDLDRNSGAGHGDLGQKSGAGHKDLDQNSGAGVDQKSGGPLDRNSGHRTISTRNHIHEEPELPDADAPDDLGAPNGTDEIIDSAEAVEAEQLDQRTPQTLVAEWLDHRTTRPPQRVIGHLSKEIKNLLDEGYEYELVRAAVGQWHQRGLHPATLPSVMDSVQNGQHGPPNASAAERRLIAGAQRDKALAAAPSMPPEHTGTGSAMIDPFAAEAQQIHSQQQGQISNGRTAV